MRAIRAEIIIKASLWSGSPRGFPARFRAARFAAATSRLLSEIAGAVSRSSCFDEAGGFGEQEAEVEDTGLVRGYALFSKRFTNIAEIVTTVVWE
ncbi:uncharacterized protein A4U43_C05F15550 [Asparagus officinalis]|uniref:Uncharacterized protein n=1 Tax=Asparagus officinalis TaxID=4686 RepID=A0A5P1EVJ4_ASPOF|nr:uncharacterized protein A4U43_C05F15550 [Asparagus officinalis]